MTKYELYKGQVEDKAKEWQMWASEQSLSYGELAEYGNYFMKLGKRYGLLKVFRENGIV